MVGPKLEIMSVNLFSMQPASSFDFESLRSQTSSVFCHHYDHHPDDQEHLSRCSASCGGGERMVEHLCKDSQTERVVNDGLCDLQVI